MNCIITGCCLHQINADRFAHGDLFEVGDCYVLHTVQNGLQATRWFAAPTSAMIVATVAGNFFDREGVIVIPKHLCAMNDAAKRYVHGDRTVEL